MSCRPPSSHKDGEPTEPEEFVAASAWQECEYCAQSQTEIIERPNPQDAAKIELLNRDGSGQITFAKQKLANQESAQREKQTHTENSRIGNGVKQRCESSQ